MKLAILFLLAATPATAATYYVDCGNATGLASDSNNGTTKTTPWLHAPGMVGFGATYSHAAGDQIIFYGGSTCPVSYFPWTISNSGTNSAQDYYGVDPTWWTGTNSGTVNTNGTIVTWASGNGFPNGSSWVGGSITINSVVYTVATVKDAEHLTLTTSAGTQTGVSYSNSLFVRPAFDGGNTGPSGDWVVISGNFVTLDSIEFKRQGVNAGSLARAVSMQGTNDLVENVWVHAWHLIGSCASGDDSANGLFGITMAGTNAIVDHLTWNGADNTVYSGSSGTTSMGGAIGDPTGFASIARYSTIHDAPNSICCGTPAAAYGNTLYNMQESCDSAQHENGIETNSNATRVEIYDNVIYNRLGAGVATVFLCGNSDFYNNVVFNDAGNPLQIDTNCGSDSSASAFLYNNTFQVSSGQLIRIVNRGTSLGSLTLSNNHFITDTTTTPLCTSVQDSSNCSVVTTLTICGASANGNSVGSCEAQQTNAVANGQGYLATEPNPYSPTSATDATVGIGSNLTISCSSLTALCSDILGVGRPATSPPNWDAGAYQFQSTGGLPMVTAISETMGAQGTTVNLTVTGTNFVTGAGNSTVLFSGAGVTVQNTNVVSTTSITTQLVISSTATTGAQNITVMTSAGTSNAESFTVEPPPTLTSLSQTTSAQGTTTPTITLTGTNFFSPAMISFSGTGITANNVTVTSATTITATFTIAANAPLGAQTVFVTTDGVTTSNMVQFTVSLPAPALTSLSVTMGGQGGMISETLTGTNFQMGVGNTTISFSGTGITASNINVTSATSLTATFAVAAGASTGMHLVFVTTTGGTSTNMVQFTVEAAPTLVSLSQTMSAQGTTTGTITLTGTNFFSPAMISFSGTGITANSATVTSPTTITATFTIAANAPLGAQTVFVTTDGVTTSNVVQFTVNGAPTLTMISPNSGNVGTTTGTITLTGTNFFSPASISFSGSGITANNPTVTSPTTITATFTISGTATLGAQTVFVTTDGATTSSVVQFTVNAPPPTITMINPSAGALGTTITTVTITGTNFEQGSNPLVTIGGGSGITVTNATIVNSTTITATFAIAANATTPAVTVQVNTAGGPSNNQAFGVGTDFMISDNPTSQTVTPGGGAMTVLTIMPTTANTQFPANVQLSASGLPNLSSCNFTSTAMGFTSGSTGTLPAMDGTAASTMVTFSCTTTAASVPPQMQGPRGPANLRPLVILAWGTLLLALCAGIIALRRERGARLRWTLAAILILAFSGLTSACHSSSPHTSMGMGTTPGNYAVTVSATSGNVTHTTTFTIMVSQ